MALRPMERPVAVARDPWSEFECRATPPDVTACVDVASLGSAYAYLLGIYLGDGTISAAPRNVWKLRVFQDVRCGQIVDEIAGAMETLSSRPSGRVRKQGCVEIYGSWKHWTCLFPQHGQGHKHQRRISLKDWQQQVVERYPTALLRGLIHSDGCRVMNRVRRPTKSGMKWYEYPRYHFTNASDDIRAIFTATCALAGVACRPNNERNISVARRDSVALMDSFIWPKR